MSVRRFRALVRGLPYRDSATGAILGVRQVGEWSHTEELLAGLCELVDAGNRLFYDAHTPRGTPPAKPITVHRPTRTRPDDEGRMATPEEMAAFFGPAVPAPLYDDEGSPAPMVDHLA